jgi:putative Mg2+ transporter-C (MgtC) family protein
MGDTLTVELLIVLRIGLAMALGAVIGLEREFATRSAGLRTHMLIAGMAALIVGLGKLLADDFTEEDYRSLVRVEPVNLISAVIAAVGFVGTGTIIQQGRTEQVHGLTTAASLLMVSGIGIAAGFNHYVLAIGATLLSVFVLLVLRWWEERRTRRD